jgi:hypothetical protein
MRIAQGIFRDIICQYFYFLTHWPIIAESPD